MSRQSRILDRLTQAFSPLHLEVEDDSARHAGHADIIREAIDGSAGLREGVSNLPPEAGAAAWKQHCEKLERIARSARPASL